MKKELFLTAVLLWLICSLTVFGQQPDFSGRWVMDPDRSFSLGPVLGVTMILSHQGLDLKLDAKLVSSEGEREVHEVWRLDGQEHPVTSADAKAGPKVLRKAYWLPDNKRLVLVEETTTETPQGPSVQVVTRKYSLSADRSVLTVDYYIDRPQGSGEAKRVFLRR